MENVTQTEKQATIITPNNFDLSDYLKHESEFMHECYVAQLEATPNLKRNEFMELHFIGRGYANGYLHYYCGNRHKPVYEAKR
jgi:hypothetical protein